jgi:hypothetical protein
MPGKISFCAETRRLRSHSRVIFAFFETARRILYARLYERKERDLYFGVGLNLQELPFGAPGVKSHWIGQVGRSVLEYVQVPSTLLDARHGIDSK